MPTIDIENPRITFARVTIHVDGKEILCKSISYGDSVERGDIEGNARMALGFSDGMYKTDDGEITVYAEDYATIIDAFGDKFYDKSFSVSVTYDAGTPAGGGGKLTKDELMGCRWTKRGATNEAGGDALTRTLGFKPAYIKMNGRAPLSKMPTGTK